MIKTLFASTCLIACCMGNEYPAKSQYIDNPILRNQIEEQRNNYNNQQREMYYQDLEIRRLGQEMENKRYGY